MEQTLERTSEPLTAPAAPITRLWNALLGTSNQAGPLIARVTLGAIMFPHGAQKLLGWFGGAGYSGTMEFFTGKMGIPAALALLAILTEFFAPLALVSGLFSRVAALGIAVVMLVATLTVQLPNGFFMNWFGNQKGEGIEYSLLMIGLAVIVIWHGGGAFSLDRLLTRRSSR